MFLRLLLLCSLCSFGFGGHSKRQLGPLQWYEQLRLPANAPSHQHQFQDRATVVFTPQYSHLDHYRRAEPEQVATVARLYPVLIQFLSPEPSHVEQPPHLEPQYQLSLEPLPNYQQVEDEEEKAAEDKPRPEGNNSTQPQQFGYKVSTRGRPEDPLPSPPLKTRRQL